MLPYVTISIVSSLGALSADDARRLGAKAGAVLIALWLIAVGFAFLFPLAFPQVESATFFSTTLIERRAPFNFVDLYIPSNPFHSLANNVVPAVVLFSIVLGIALIGVERKQVLLDVLSVAGTIVLPSLIDASKELLACHGLAHPHTKDLPDVIVPASFGVLDRAAPGVRGCRAPVQHEAGVPGR